jgi:hypothetical protein
VINYFANPVTLEVMPSTMVAQGGFVINLSNLCPIPLVWAPYFMGFKALYEVLKMGKAPMATLDDVAQ